MHSPFLLLHQQEGIIETDKSWSKTSLPLHMYNYMYISVFNSNIYVSLYIFL